MRITRHIPDYLLVTLITVLVWLYAEGRNVQTYSPGEPVPVSVSLVNDEDLAIMEQSPRRVSIRFQGATSELDRVRRRLPGGINLEVAVAEPGRRTFSLAELLRRAEPIAGLRVNISRVEPPSLELEVDRLLRHQLRLRFEPTDVQLVPDSVEIEPAEAELTLPESMAAELGSDLESLRLDVEVSEDLRQLPAGERQTVTGRVRLPAVLRGQQHVQVEPREVTVSFVIDKKEEQVTLPSVPVWVVAPPSELEKYRVELVEGSRVLRDVTVTGPSDLVQQVRERSLRVIALLYLSSDDLASGVGSEVSAPVTFDLPAALRVEAPTQTVRFTIERTDG